MRVSSAASGSSSRPYASCGAAADAEVADRQHVRPAEVEDQEHVHGPVAQALDRGQLLDHLLVRQLRDVVEVELAVLDVLGQVAQVGDLGAREARRAQELGVGGHDLGGRGRAPLEQAGQPLVDRARGLGGELLADDRAQQRAVGVGGAPAAALEHALGRLVGLEQPAITGSAARRCSTAAALLDDRVGPASCAGTGHRPKATRPASAAGCGTAPRPRRARWTAGRRTATRARSGASWRSASSLPSTPDA